MFADSVVGLAINPPEHVGAPFEGAPARTNVDWPFPACRLTDVGIEKTVVAEQVTVLPDCVQVVLEAPFAWALTLTGIIDTTVPATSVNKAPTEICRCLSRSNAPKLICSLLTRVAINIGIP